MISVSRFDMLLLMVFVPKIDNMEDVERCSMVKPRETSYNVVFVGGDIIRVSQKLKLQSCLGLRLHQEDVRHIFVDSN